METSVRMLTRLSPYCRRALCLQSLPAGKLCRSAECGQGACARRLEVSSKLERRPPEISGAELWACFPAWSFYPIRATVARHGADGRAGRAAGLRSAGRRAVAGPTASLPAGSAAGLGVPPQLTL